MREQGYGVREIGRFLSIDASVVSRELRRNFPPFRLRLSGQGRAEWAHKRAKERLKERKRGKKGTIADVKVREHIVEKLIAKVSPEAIAATMEEELGKKVSYSTIYRWIKREVPELKKYLFEKGKRRRQRVMNRRGRFQQAAAAKRSLDERPAEADDRSEVGHLEGDTIQGRKGSSAAVLSVRDRKTRLHWFEKVENLESATVSRAIARLLHRIPAAFRKTLTFDRGAEFANWPMIEKIFPSLVIYFCDAYCPYQKGSNERGNRDFRKYYPKGSNFEGVMPEEVREVQKKVNLHPMKLHQWRSPSEVAAQFALAIAV
jgi:IS30 family transposase